MHAFARIILCLTAICLCQACVYRINIQQGNFLDQTAVEQVKAGMTRSQVRYLLGTPLATDSFDKDRWDYIYYFRAGWARHVDSRRVTVYFDDADKVTKIDKPSAALAAQQDANAAKAKKLRVYQ